MHKHLSLTQHVCDEDTVEFGRLQQFGKLDPVLNIVKL